MLAANENPALAGERRGAGISERVTPSDCQTPHANASDFAAIYIARRYRLPMPMARIVAGLAQLGERLS